MSRSIPLLKALIAIPSVNPAFTSAEDPLTGERRVADYLGAEARKQKLDVEKVEVLPGRSNLMVSLTPSGKVRRRILLAPHMDTVPPHRPDQLIPREERGKIFGRGACDTKGSVASYFAALANVANLPASQRPASTEIVFVGLVDEENAQSGSRHLAKGKSKADLAIVGEPTELKVVTAHKGDLWLTLSTHGKAAHGSCPHLGINAVAAMAQVVQWLEGSYARSLHRKEHPLLGHPTVNVGMIHGGTQPNIVPSLCEISIDRRTIPGEQDAQIIAELKRELKKLGHRVDIRDWKGAPSRPMETDPRSPLVQQLMKLGDQVKPEGVHYFSDAGVLADGGIPSVVYGPGRIAQAHTSDEWVAVSQVEKAEARLTRFLSSQP